MLNYDHPDALDFQLAVERIQQLLLGKNVSMPKYDLGTHDREESFEPLAAREFIIFEGILTLANLQLRELSHLSVFVDAPDELRFKRRLARDQQERARTKESVYQQWETTVYPMHCKFCDPTKEFADSIVSGEEDANLTASRIAQTLLAGQKI
jgi:uridine kinase